MTTMINKLALEEMQEVNRFVVIHPLDDLPETKVDTKNLGRMPMTRTVKISLLALRGYLLLMSGLVLVQFIRPAVK